eukprot:5264649-Prymnesium_polylepis.1
MHTETAQHAPRTARRRPRLGKAVEGEPERHRLPRAVAPQLEVVKVAVGVFHAAPHHLHPTDGRAVCAEPGLHLRVVGGALVVLEPEPWSPSATALWPKVVHVTVALLEPRVPHLEAGDHLAGGTDGLLAFALRASLRLAREGRHDPMQPPPQAARLLAVVAERREPEPGRPLAARVE